jgi:hypothetical protein
MKEEKEIWKVIPGFSKYEASNLGRIRSIRFQRLLKLGMCNRGYLRVTLRNNSDEKKTFHIHRAVLLAFVGPLPKGMVSRHLDGNPLNNKLSNLKYGTYQENSQDSFNHGTHSTQKLDAEDAKDIRRLWEDGDLNQKQIAKEFKVGRSQISRIINHRAWKHI